MWLLKIGKAASETGQRGSERWSSYENVGRAGSVIPTTSLAGSEVSVDEIRSAASMSVPYSPYLHAPLISSPQSQSQPQFYGKFPADILSHTSLFCVEFYILPLVYFKGGVWRGIDCNKNERLFQKYHSNKTIGTF